jgi:uncharacterized membrane protein
MEGLFASELNGQPYLRLNAIRACCAERHRTDAPSEASLPATFARDARPVAALEDGYLQFIDAEALMALAS